MAFLFLTTDPFKNTIQTTLEKNEEQDELLYQPRPIRRPYRGIQIKGDTYSTLSVRTPDGRAIKLTSSSETNDGTMSKPRGKGQVAEYSDYILQSVQDQRTEKQQIIETFGAPFVYFFGERPRVVQFSGLLVNTEDFNWRSQFWANYDEYIRGTKLVQRNARAYLSFDTIVIEGYVLQASAVENAEMPYSIPFSFSMFVTNYYDWSRIGERRFPGYGQEVDLDVLNKELEDRRAEFTPSGAEVRMKNLLADPGGGILSTLRSGIRAVNDAVSFVGGLTDTIHDVIGGRVVRMPIGIAGYLSSVGAATISTGSISTDSVTAETLGEQYDTATSGYDSLKGSVKLRMPGTSKYATPWTSAVSGGPIGYIFENVDEYPNRGNETTLLSQLVSQKDYMSIVERKYNRQLAVEENQIHLAVWNQTAEAGGILGDIAEGVAFAKANFGMVMSIASFARDPLNGLKASLGIGIGTTSQSRIAGRSDDLAKRGIKTSAQEEANRSLLEKTGRWIGESAFNTFSNVVNAEASSPEPASLGNVYNNSAYQQQQAEAGEGDFAYEPAYGSKNYSALVAADPSTAASLDEVYGNNDDAPEGSDVRPASFDEVYGTGSSSSSVRSPEEIAAALAQAQSNDVPADEDTQGITGVGDVDAEIDPVI